MATTKQCSAYQRMTYEEIVDQPVLRVDEETWTLVQGILSQPPQAPASRLAALFAEPPLFD